MPEGCWVLCMGVASRVVGTDGASAGAREHSATGGPAFTGPRRGGEEGGPPRARVPGPRPRARPRVLAPLAAAQGRRQVGGAGRTGTAGAVRGVRERAAAQRQT